MKSYSSRRAESRVPASERPRHLGWRLFAALGLQLRPDLGQRGAHRRVRPHARRLHGVHHDHATGMHGFRLRLSRYGHGEPAGGRQLRVHLRCRLHWAAMQIAHRHGLRALKKWLSAGDCVAPLQKDIPNSALLTCEEGSRPTMQCTAHCKETYYPVPATLDCQGRGWVTPRS